MVASGISVAHIFIPPLIDSHTGENTPEEASTTLNTTSGK